LSKRTRAEILLVLVTLVWGSTFVIVKEALQDASPLPFLSIRFLLAGALLLVVVGRAPSDRSAVVPGIILGVFLFGGYVFQTWGLKHTTPSKSAFITGFSVVLVPLILVFRGHRLQRASVMGALLGLAGIYLLAVPSSVGAINRGDLLTLLGATSFALHIVFVGTYTRRFSFLYLVPTQILTVGMLATVGLPLDPDHLLNWTPRLVGAIVVTAVFATGFAFSAQNWAQRYAPPAHTALIFALEPVFAAATSRLVTGEHLGGKALVGSLLVLLGMVVSEVWGGSGPSPVEG